MIIATTRTQKLPLVPRAKNSLPGFEEAESLSSALSAVLAESFASEADVLPQGLTSQTLDPCSEKNAFAVPWASQRMRDQPGCGLVNLRIQDWRGTRSDVHLVSTIHSEGFESRQCVRSSSYERWCWGCPKPGDSTRFQILIGK